MTKSLLLVLMLLFSSSINAAPLIQVVAMVNNDAVTSYKLDKALAYAMAADIDKNQLSKDEYRALKVNVLNGMIEDLLVEQRIRELGLSVSEQEVDAAVEDVQRQNNLTREQLLNALQAQGMSFADYRQNLRKEVLRYKLIGREVRSKIEVTNTQIREYFKAHEQDYTQPPTLRLARISFPVSADAKAKSKEKLFQQAQIARQQLLAGKPFPEVLSSLSDGGEGADMGTLIEKEMNPILREMVSGLSVDQVSEPREALGSIHIFKVLERNPAKAELTEDIRDAIEQILAKQNSEERFSEWKADLRKEAVIDIRI